MKLLVTRDISTPRSLTSVVWAWDPSARDAGLPQTDSLCFGLEPFWDPSGTVKPRAIPPDTYEVKIQYSPKHGRTMPWVLGVPGFDAVEIHWGNFEFPHQDAHGIWHPPDSDACLVVGEQRGVDEVLTSVPIFKKLYAMLKGAEAMGETNTITYVNVWQIHQATGVSAS